MAAAASRDISSLSIAAVEESLTGRREPMRIIAALSESDLAASFDTDNARLAFWINVYNAGVQLHLRARPELYRHRTRFFARRGIVVAGQRLTFNTIEHGLLRRSRFAYSLGYVQNPLPSRFERRFRLRERDPRVHFALNCGARSCPPLNGYWPHDVDARLEVATTDYLRTGCSYDSSSGSVTVPRLLLWFRGDFGGPAGIRTLLRRHGVIPDAAEPRLRYADYDWSLDLPTP